MSEGWSVYVALVEGKMASFFLNLEARKNPDSPRPRRCVVKIALRERREDGFSAPSEDDQLWKFEDEFAKRIAEDHSGEYVGRYTSDSQRTFCAYLPPTAPIAAQLGAALKQSFPVYDIQCHEEKDEHWEYYFQFLYPAPEDMQRILNDRVIQSLEKSGDDFTTPRPIDHTIHFQDADNLAKFKTQAVALRYKILRETRDDQGKWKLEISRKDIPIWKYIDEITMRLFRLATETQGEYTGWTCAVTKGKGR